MQKRMSRLIVLTNATSFTMRGATGITLQPHQILRLPHKIAFPNLRKIHGKRLKCHIQCATDPTMIPRPIRACSDHENANRNPPRRRGYFSRSLETYLIENYNISLSGYHSTFHQMLRRPQKETRKLHQMLRLPRKVTDQLHSPNATHT